MALAARIQLASTLRNIGETHESVEILEAAVAEHPQYGAARMFLALALVSDGREMEAVQLLLDLLLTNPGPPERYARSLRNYTDDLGRTTRIDRMIADGRITPARGRPRDLRPPPPPTDPTDPPLSEILQQMRDEDPR